MAVDGKHKTETEERTPRVGESISVWANDTESPGLVAYIYQDERWRAITATVFQGSNQIMLQLKYNTGPFERSWCYPGERA